MGLAPLPVDDDVLVHKWDYTTLRDAPPLHPDAAQWYMPIYRGIVPAKLIASRDFALNGVVVRSIHYLTQRRQLTLVIISSCLQISATRTKSPHTGSRPSSWGMICPGFPRHPPQRSQRASAPRRGCASGTLKFRPRCAGAERASSLFGRASCSTVRRSFSDDAVQVATACRRPVGGHGFACDAQWWELVDLAVPSSQSARNCDVEGRARRAAGGKNDLSCDL